MSIGSTLSIATQGMLNGMNRTAIAVEKISGGITEDPDAAATLIGLSQGGIETKASASVAKDADDIIGSLIDINA